MIIIHDIRVNINCTMRVRCAALRHCVKYSINSITARAMFT